jgi:hypothetical protein
MPGAGLPRRQVGNFLCDLAGGWRKSVKQISAAPFLNETPSADMLNPPHMAKRTRVHRKPIDPAIKSWIDNVIIPALLDRWNSRPERQAA